MDVREKKVTRMAEYIEREALIAEFKRLSLGENSIIERLFADGVYAVIETFQAVDVAPVVHGRWLHTEEPLGWKDVDCMECSACHDSWIIEEDYCFDDMPLWNYCPSCGAKMDGGED